VGLTLSFCGINICCWRDFCPRDALSRLSLDAGVLLNSCRRRCMWPVRRARNGPSLQTLVASLVHGSNREAGVPTRRMPLLARVHTPPRPRVLLQVVKRCKSYARSCMNADRLEHSILSDDFLSIKVNYDWKCCFWPKVTVEMDGVHRVSLPRRGFVQQESIGEKDVPQKEGKASVIQSQPLLATRTWARDGPTETQSANRGGDFRAFSGPSKRESTVHHSVISSSGSALFCIL
jgi:hypothetical protein